MKYNTRDDAVLDLIFSSEPGMIENLEASKSIYIIGLLSVFQ